jgi:hypothetical protein
MGFRMSRYNEIPFRALPIPTVWPNFSASCLQGDGAKKIERQLISVDRHETNRKNVMTSPAVRNDTQIDHVSSAAICEEIGDRLRIKLKGEPNRLPQHMTMLVEQMAQNDYVSAALSDTSETGSKPIKSVNTSRAAVMLRLNQNAEVAK